MQSVSSGSCHLAYDWMRAWLTADHGADVVMCVPSSEAVAAIPCAVQLRVVDGVGVAAAARASEMPVPPRYVGQPQ